MTATNLFKTESKEWKGMWVLFNTFTARKRYCNVNIDNFLLWIQNKKNKSYLPGNVCPSNLLDNCICNRWLCRYMSHRSGRVNSYTHLCLYTNKQCSYFNLIITKNRNLIIIYMFYCLIFKLLDILRLNVLLIYVHYQKHDKRCWLSFPKIQTQNSSNINHQFKCPHE